MPVTDGGGLAVASDDQGSDPAVSGDQAPHGEFARHGVELDAQGNVKQVFFLDEDSPEPLYLQVAAHVRGRIERGELTGRLLPETVMAARYGVSRRTVREALRKLQDEGLIRSWQGRGTFALPRP